MTNFRIERIPFDADAVQVWARADERHQNWPVVYAIDDSKEIYVGESTNVSHRIQQHLQSPSRKHLKRVKVVLDETFNKSVCLDLESQLISYFAADGKYAVLNRNLGITNADYFDRARYREKFSLVFDELLREGMLTRSIPDIVNSDLFKYSPFKALTPDQAVAIEGILETIFDDLLRNRSGSLVIQGDPGTGKTIVAVYLIKLLRDIAESGSDDDLDTDSMFSEFFQGEYQAVLNGLKIGFVIPQQSLRKTIRKVFKRTPGLNPGMVMSQTEAAKSPDPFDLLIVDETHRLWHRANQASASGNKDFKEINERLFGRDDSQYTQLDWMKAISRHQIFLVDPEQTVRPGDLPRTQLALLESQARSEERFFNLTSQMRVAAGSDYINFVRGFLSDEPATWSDNADYDFRFFENFGDMVREIRNREREVGLSRLVAGYAWPWVSKKDPGSFDITIDGFSFRWNTTVTDWVNSATAANEVGSIHTVQGYDLNYAAVVIGRDLVFDREAGRIVFHRANYFDAKGKENNKQLGITYTDEDLLDYVRNIYRVLMTRGIKGTYVYVCDDALREFLREKLSTG